MLLKNKALKVVKKIAKKEHKKVKGGSSNGIISEDLTIM